MLEVAIAEAVGLVVVVFLFLRRQAEAEAAVNAERQVLLERVQRPERPPVTESVKVEAPEVEEDELNLVGAILEPK